jgi:hypothetical protein
MLAGATVGAELKALLRGDQRMAAFHAKGECFAQHAGRFGAIAPKSMFGRCRDFVIGLRVEPDMDDRNVLAAPALKCRMV